MHCECDGVMVYWTRRIAAMSTAVYIEAVRNAAARDAAARDTAVRDAAARDAAIRRRSTGVLFSGLFILKFSGFVSMTKNDAGYASSLIPKNIDYG